MDEKQLEQENEILLNDIKEAVKKLMPYFDTVQVFCTKHESADIGTSKFSYGNGNFWAIYGQVIDWIKREDRAREDE